MGLFGNSYPAIDIKDSTVLITGAGRGIGRATAELFAAKGARVALADVDYPAAKAASAGAASAAAGALSPVLIAPAFPASPY